jgi:predicted TIM-barrel fold metal-dependent hydrolase
MPYNGHLVVDADSHMREYWDFDRTFKEFIDPKYAQSYERFSAAVKGAQRNPGDTGLAGIWPHERPRPLGVREGFDRPIADRSTPRAVVESGREIDPACNWDPSIRLRDMSEADIDVGVMFSSQSDNFCQLRDVGFEHALHEAYGRYMTVFCGESEGRLRWLSNATMRDIEATVADVTYWAERDPNYGGVFIPRAFPDQSGLDNPELHPLLERCQDLDMPVWVHGDPNHPPHTPGGDDPAFGSFARQVLKGWGGMAALGALIGGGAFDLFPRVRIGFFENGGGWMPWFVEKADDSYTPGGSGTPYMKRKPSDIIAGGQVFVAIDTGETELSHAVDTLGEHLWLFSTDYPHSRNPWPDGVPQITERTDLSESAKIAMLGENARRFLPKIK